MVVCAMLTMAVGVSVSFMPLMPLAEVVIAFLVETGDSVLLTLVALTVELTEILDVAEGSVADEVAARWYSTG